MVLFNTNPEADFLQPETLPYWWILYLVSSLSILALAVVISYWWSQADWSCHPIAHNLQRLALTGSTWRSVASSINTEFRRFDKLLCIILIIYSYLKSILWKYAMNNSTGINNVCVLWASAHWHFILTLLLMITGDNLTVPLIHLYEFMSVMNVWTYSASVI